MKGGMQRDRIDRWGAQGESVGRGWQKTGRDQFVWTWIMAPTDRGLDPLVYLI